MKKQSFEDYLRTYLKNRAAELGAEGYSRWLAENGADTERLRAQSTARAAIAYATGKPTYGVAAADMLRRGMTGSGYADYLGTRVKSSYEKRLAGIASEYNEGRVGALSEYSDYLDDTERERDALYEKVYSTLRSRGISSLTEAYKYATEAGIDANTAKELSRSVTDEVRAQYRRKVLSAVVSDDLTAEQTREYAVGLGLTETDAAELARFAELLNQMPYVNTDSAMSYVEYMKAVERAKRKEQEK